MGLLDSVLGGLLGGGSGGSPMQGVLMNLLGGGQQGQQQGYAQQGAPSAGGLGGGLAGLLATFQQAGLGNIAQSWVGTGANQPVSPQQLQTALGPDQVQTLASQANMAPHDFLSQLSEHLPKAVDGMTPNGRLPDEGTVSV